MMIGIHLQRKLKTITEQTFFGTYHHSLTRHVTEQYRLFSGHSTNTEKEEARLMFTQILPLAII